jgi:hypothetical protein
LETFLAWVLYAARFTGVLNLRQTVSSLERRFFSLIISGVMNGLGGRSVIVIDLQGACLSRRADRVVENRST